MNAKRESTNYDAAKFQPSRHAVKLAAARLLLAFASGAITTAAKGRAKLRPPSSGINRFRLKFKRGLPLNLPSPRGRETGWPERKTCWKNSKRGQRNNPAAQVNRQHIPHADEKRGRSNSHEPRVQGKHASKPALGGDWPKAVLKLPHSTKNSRSSRVAEQFEFDLSAPRPFPPCRMTSVHAHGPHL